MESNLMLNLSAKEYDYIKNHMSSSIVEDCSNLIDIIENEIKDIDFEDNIYYEY